MKKIWSWIFLLAALTLAACSEDTEQKDGVRENPLQVATVTRSGGFSNASDSLSPIQIYMTSGNKKTEGEIVYDPDLSKWYSTIGVKEETNYIYGFSPATIATSDIQPLSGSDYSNGAVLTLSNLNAVTGDDICVIVGVENSPIPVTPQFGAFKFVKTDPNFICVLLDHIYAGIDFTFKIGEKYNDLRDIRLKRMELQSTKTVEKIVVTMTPNSTGTSPITDIKYVTNESSQQAPIYDYETDPEQGKWLTPDGVTILGCIAPITTIANNMMLTCTYDVYDKRGTCVRRDCTSTNDLSKSISEEAVERGRKSTITLTVEPTYLYQLSEPELDNPTIVVSSY
jgi:hypothetical protein